MSDDWIKQSVQELVSRQADVREQAAICAMARGDDAVRLSLAVLCPCRVIETPLVWFGPATGWLCGICMKPAQHAAPAPEAPDG